MKGVNPSMLSPGVWDYWARQFTFEKSYGVYDPLKELANILFALEVYWTSAEAEFYNGYENVSVPEAGKSKNPNAAWAVMPVGTDKGTVETIMKHRLALAIADVDDEYRTLMAKYNTNLGPERWAHDHNSTMLKKYDILVKGKLKSLFDNLKQRIEFKFTRAREHHLQYTPPTEEDSAKTAERWKKSNADGYNTRVATRERQAREAEAERRAAEAEYNRRRVGRHPGRIPGGTRRRMKNPSWKGYKLHGTKKNRKGTGPRTRRRNK